MFISFWVISLIFCLLGRHTLSENGMNLFEKSAVDGVAVYQKCPNFKIIKGYNWGTTQQVTLWIWYALTKETPEEIFLNQKNRILFCFIHNFYWKFLWKHRKTVLSEKSWLVFSPNNLYLLNFLFWTEIWVHILFGTRRNCWWLRERWQFLLCSKINAVSWLFAYWLWLLLFYSRSRIRTM